MFGAPARKSALRRGPKIARRFRAPLTQTGPKPTGDFVVADFKRFPWHWGQSGLTPARAKGGRGALEPEALTSASFGGSRLHVEANSWTQRNSNQNILQKVLQNALKKHIGNPYRTGGSTGEAWGKLGEARYFWGKHRICTLEFLEKTGEAIGPSNLFIILILGNKLKKRTSGGQDF